MTMTRHNAFAQRRHISLHLAHRWFAYLEVSGGDLDTHLMMFHPSVRLSGHRGHHLFAHDRESLVDWFAAVPDTISSHHILHSVYSDADDGDGLLQLLVAYQAPSSAGIHGSIISYETRIQFAPGAPQFRALDKTPILPNTRAEYETSWSTHRVLARLHAELGGIIPQPDIGLRNALGEDVRQILAQTNAPEGSKAYEALVTVTGGSLRKSHAIRLQIADEVNTPLPTIARIN